MTWILLGAMALAAGVAIAKMFVSASPARLRGSLNFMCAACWALGLAFTLSGKIALGLPLLGIGAIGLGALARRAGGSARSERHRRGASAGGGPHVHGDPHRSNAGGLGRSGVMTKQEAYQILGVQPGARTEEVVRAHRTLMKKAHPDQGGTTELAARLNAAKDLLVRSRHR